MKTLFVFGTRPEAIKLAPLIGEFKNNKKFLTKVCITSQHKELLTEVLRLFNIKPDYDLNLMKDNQRLDQLHAKAIISLEKVLEKEKPNLLIVQGDTTSAFCGAISAFYKKIPIAHIEAGLRSNDKYKPFPEEINRRLISVLSDYHFCPTILAKKNLLKEGIDKKKIFVVGNTVLDALRIIVSNYKIKEIAGFKYEDLKKNRIILITIHRRESWGGPLLNICNAIKKLADTFRDYIFIFPVHPNPNVCKVVYKVLSNINNLYLIKPLDYKSFIFLLKSSYLILTDSGGVQEEAPSFGKPVFVLREKTERPEIIKIGAAKLIGLNPEVIFREVKNILENEKLYKKMVNKKNPYGDGFSSRRIVKILEKEFF